MEYRLSMMSNNLIRHSVRSCGCRSVALAVRTYHGLAREVRKGPGDANTYNIEYSVLRWDTPFSLL
jgi:hypothetical protein